MRELRNRIMTPVGAVLLAGVALQLTLPLLSTRLGLVIADVPITVAVLGYDTIAKVYAAGPSKPGSAQLTVAGVKADVAAARN